MQKNNYRIACQFVFLRSHPGIDLQVYVDVINRRQQTSPPKQKLRIYNLLHAARQMEGLDSKYFRVIVTTLTVSKQNNRAHDTHIIKI